MRIFIFILILLFTRGYSQTFSIRNTSLFDSLLQKKNINLSADIGNNYQFFIPNEARFRNHSQCLIKNNNGLFCLIQATGQVYKLEKSKNDSIYVKRIDSTHFYGYNNSAIIFSNNDTIFSFGGNGFWNFNGQLRYYDVKQNEWNIIEIEKEIHGSKTLFYVDEENDALYFISNKYRDPATGATVEGNEVVKLDLKTKKLNALGKVNQKISSLFVNPNAFITCTTTPIKSLDAVLFCFDLNNNFLVNFKENTIRNLQSKKISDLFYGNSNMIRPRTFFEENSTLYYTKSNDTTFSILTEKIDINDFDTVSENLYTSETIRIESKWTFFLIIFFSILLLLGLGYFFYKNNFSREKNNNEQKNELFSPLEIDLIKSLINKSNKGDKLGCSADEINAILGLKKKSIEIQKKTRTDTISRINQKFKNKYGTEEELIIRLRTEEDRRFYRYIIKETNGSRVFD